MGKKYDLLVKEVNAILDQYQTKMTLRQIYYRLVAKLIIPNNLNQYKALSKILVKARENNDVDYTMIEDRARTTIGRDGGFDSAEEFKEYKEEDFKDGWDQFTMPMWTTQSEFLEVWVEKDALSRLCSDIAQGFRVKTCPSRGYSSYTYIMEAVNRLQNVEGKDITILYLGDYDPSGLDITRDLEDRLYRYGADVEVERLALNIDQIEEHNLPPMPAKSSDPRLAKFIADTGGRDAVELDALEPPILQEIIRKGIRNHLDAEAWEERRIFIAQEKAKLKEVFEKVTIEWGEENDSSDG